MQRKHAGNNSLLAYRTSEESQVMTELLSPTGQAIADILIAVVVGLIFAHLAWIAIRRLLLRQAEKQAKAEMDAHLAANYPETMTDEQCEEMQKQKWSGD